MNILSADRVAELVHGITWKDDEVLRVFWLCVSGPRDAMSRELSRSIETEEIVSLVVRDRWFTNSNEVLSDMTRLFEQAKVQLQALAPRRPEKLTVVILAKSDLNFPQVSSPIQLPNWFPVRPGLETFFYLRDLLGVNEGGLLNSPELMVDRVAAQTHSLEEVLVSLLVQRADVHGPSVTAFLQRLTQKQDVDTRACIAAYEDHLRTVVDPRAYRPNASAATKSLVTDILKRVLDSSPPRLAEHAVALGKQVVVGSGRIKPSYFGVALRPKIVMTDSEANWHSIMLGLYQAYQMMNAAAHAGDYGRYPIGVLHYMSLDLQCFLQSAYEHLSQSFSDTAPQIR